LPSGHYPARFTFHQNKPSKQTIETKDTAAPLVNTQAAVSFLVQINIRLRWVSQLFLGMIYIYQQDLI